MHRRAGAALGEYITYKKDVVHSAVFHYTSIMALRLNEVVVRGLIDNREKGKVSGNLWLAGQGAPIGFELVGDCDRDLSGLLVELINRNTPPTASSRKLKAEVGEVVTIIANT